jgi:phage terminase large subunit GpA-like protein
VVDESRAEDEGTTPRLREIEAEYQLEYAVKCPHCGEDLDTVRVVRLLRTKVNFTSMLPRRGRVISCPICLKVLSAELSVAG